MQDVLPGDTDGAVNLMRDGSSLRGGLGGADFCRDRFEENRLVECLGVGDRVGRLSRRRESRRDLSRLAWEH